MKEFSYKTRQQNLSDLATNKFDLVIIGGGITGAGVARDAALRGLRVALVEENDFAFGTSSRSSKLVHGGIRYLENMEFKLVFEALSERTKLFSLAPHLVHPLRFMIPLFEDSRVGMFKMGLGMWLYDALSLFQTPEMHEGLSAKITLNRMPILQNQKLKGSYVYSDAYMDDDRLTIETLRSAHEAGAVCLNYVKASKSISDKNNKITGLEVRDLKTNLDIKISAPFIISTVGPWTDMVAPKLVDNWKNILRPTKGVHLTFLKDRLPLTSAVVMGAEKSDRIVFAIPRHEMVIIGTTDTDYKGDPAKVTVTKEDVVYLLKVANQYFPGAYLTESDIVSSYVGVRPLVQDSSQSEGKTSREHTIIKDDRGLIFVAGGKYTTYRLMSEQIVDAYIKTLPFEKRVQYKNCETNRPLNSQISEDLYTEAKNQASNELEKRLAERHGLEYITILERYKNTNNYYALEAYHAIHHTMCVSLTDFYSRRLPLVLSQKDHGLSHLDVISEVFSSEFGWSLSELEVQINDLKRYIQNQINWKN